MEEDYKAEVADKIRGLKSELIKALKRIDQLSHGKSAEERSQINGMEERLLRIEHLLEGKADTDGVKKLLTYLENKLSYLYRIVNVEGNEEDALIAKKNWLCLSCDKKLDTYKGRIGSHLNHNQLKGKLLESEVAGGGMMFKSKSKYDLPTVNKQKKFDLP